MPRTTLDLDGTVLKELRQRAKAEGKSMGTVASELLAVGLDGRSVQAPPPFNWIRRDLGLKIDIEDKDAVWRILDAEEFGDRGN